MTNMARRSRRCALPLVLAAVFTLAACQRTGTIQRADGWDRPEPFGAAGVAGERRDAGLPGLLPLASDDNAPRSSRRPGAQTPDLPYVDPATGLTGTGPGTAATAGPRDLPESPGSGTAAAPPEGSTTATPLGTRFTDHSLDNPTAADLLDHWGHRRVQGLVESLSLGMPASQAEAAGKQALQPRDLTGAGRLLTGELEGGAEVRLLGARHGVTYGRWTGGPADTVSVEFDLSRAGSQMSDDPAFPAMLERAGKAWSRRIADTLPTWERAPGDIKGWLRNDTRREAMVLVGSEGETSARFEIDVKDNDLAGGFAGRGGGSWERRFGRVQMDREYLEDAGERSLMGVLAHEIGHVLGAWSVGDEPPEHIEALIDRSAGTWTGPNVVALHGGPAPFQDAADPHAWVDGERSPYASEFDFAHSGVCSSVMAYCRHRDPRPSILPQAIDFAFLSDIGVTVTEETTRAETYGLVGWTDHAGFSLSVSRDLEFHLPDRDVRNNRGAWFDAALDVTDRLRVEVDTFGYPSVGDLLQFFPAADLQGTVRYTGGLLGTALDLTGLPPVTGSSSLAVDLGTLGGTASFTSLAVHTGGVSEPFAGGALHYAFALDGNAIVGTDTSSTLLADFYGPWRQDAAGTLHDPDAGLLASFGATYDDRPARADVIASADHLSGFAWRGGSTVESENGWSEYRCGADSDCEGRDEVSGQWGEWTSETRVSVLAATAGWSGRGTARPHADHDFVRIARQWAPSADGGTDEADAYAGTLEHGAFGIGFETYEDPWAEFATDVLEVWTGIQGAASGGVPAGSARWSGLMLGYRHGQAAGDDLFVEGHASLALSLPGSELDVSELDVAFSGVASLDGLHRLDDFGFEDVPMHNDGTFWVGGDSGALRGALFGPAHEEAAGTFHHNAARVTGSFGTVRLPDPPPVEEDASTATRAPIVDLDGTRHVGADVAPEAGALTPGRERNGVAVSSGDVQDGESAEGVIEYLTQHIDDEYRFTRSTAGLPTLSEPPIVRLAEGTSEEFSAYVEHTVQLINTALPVEQRIVLSPEPAPPLTALAEVPEGQIFVDFAPSQDDWELGGRFEYTWTDYDGIPVMVAEVDPTAEYDHAARRWEYVGMRAGRIWFDREVLETQLNTVRVWEWDTDRNEWRDELRTELRESRPDESDTVRHSYTDEYVTRMTMSALLRALGLLRRVDSADFPDSFLGDESRPRISHLPGIDGDALFAAYARLAPGTVPEDLSPESLGPWEDTSFHLRGDLDLAGGEAAFGVALRNDLARPWAAGTAPLADLADNTALFGTASWNGALLGVTPEERTVSGDARLAVELSTVEGQLDFTGLEHWGERAAPGEAGTGTAWGDGDLGYSVRVDGNGFVQTGGDEGEVTGGFFGRAHEAMGGVLQRDDLSAGFGGVR